jgi:hypothetical protein
MSSNLFNNKYYNQLFGGKQQQEQEESMDSQSTEDTRQRLERIFGGAKGKKGTGKPRVTGMRKTDAQILAEGKVTDAGRMDGRQLFEFKNGARAIRDDNGRFIIVQGASAAKMAELRGARKGPKVERVGADKAKKAFAAYWNRKMREAKSFDKKNGLKGKDSRAAAVKRSKSVHLKYAHKNTARHLTPESDKGYLYLRKERVLRNADGSPSRGKDGRVRVRRAGPAIYDFIGVAPEKIAYRKSSVRVGAIEKARAGRDAVQAAKLGMSLAQYQGMSKAAKAQASATRRASTSSKKARAASAGNAIAARNATLAARKQMRGEWHTPKMAPHAGVPAKKRVVKKGKKAAAEVEEF